jgi:hypothetical protein
MATIEIRRGESVRLCIPAQFYAPAQPVQAPRTALPLWLIVIGVWAYDLAAAVQNMV